MSDFDPEFQAACTQLFDGWSKAMDQSLRRIQERCQIPENMRSRLWRLFQGQKAPDWDQFLLDHLLPVTAKDLEVPPDDIVAHLRGKESAHASQYQELKKASFLLPRPGYDARLAKILAQHEAEATHSISIVKFLPVSLPPEEISHMHQADLARRLGKTGLRLLPKMKKFATDRNAEFTSGKGVFNGGNALVYLLKSDFVMMRNGSDPFAGLSDDFYEDFLTTLSRDVVRQQRVRILLIDDLRSPLPIGLRQFLHGFDAIFAIGNDFTMRIHAGKFIRSFCDRNVDPRRSSAQIDQTIQMLRSLDQYVTHSKTIDGIAEFLKSYSREAA